MGRASQRRAELGRGLQTPGPHATAPGLVTGKDAPAPGKGGPWGTDGQVVAHGEMAAPLPDGHADGSGPRGRRGRATAGGGARGQSGKADVFRASFSVVGLVALFSRDFSERGFCSDFRKSKGAQGRLFIGWI